MNKEETIFVGPTGNTATQMQFDQMPQSIKVFYNEGGK